MAAKPEHHPDYNKLSARLKRARRAFNESAVGLYLKNTLAFYSEKDCDHGDMALKASGFTFSFMGGAIMLGQAFMDEQYDVTTQLPPETDQAAAFDADLSENGHIAFSYDNGETGYALIRYGNDYRLYSFEQQRNGAVLTYVQDDDEAWYQARIMADQYRNLRDAAGNAPQELTAESWEVFQINDLSEFIVHEDGEIARYGTSLYEVEHNGIVHRYQHYDTLSSIWSDAADVFAHGYEGITPNEMEVRAGEFRTDVELRNNDMKDFLQVMGYILLGVGGSLGLGGGIGPTRKQIKRRDRERELQKGCRIPRQNKYF